MGQGKKDLTFKKSAAQQAHPTDRILLWLTRHSICL